MVHSPTHLPMHPFSHSRTHVPTPVSLPLSAACPPIHLTHPPHALPPIQFYPPAPAATHACACAPIHSRTHPQASPPYPLQSCLIIELPAEVCPHAPQRLSEHGLPGALQYRSVLTRWQASETSRLHAHHQNSQICHELPAVSILANGKG